MMRCNKCGKIVALDQVPEVHVSQVEEPCDDPNCDGMATYRNNVTKTVEATSEKPLVEKRYSDNTQPHLEWRKGSIKGTADFLSEDDPGEHHG